MKVCLRLHHFSHHVKRLSENCYKFNAILASPNYSNLKPINKYLKREIMLDQSEMVLKQMKDKQIPVVRLNCVSQQVVS